MNFVLKLWVLWTSLLIFSCNNLETASITSIAPAEDGCLKNPQLILPVIFYNTEEIPDPCMLYWPRKGHSLGGYIPSKAVLDLARQKLSEMFAAAPFHYYIESGYRSYQDQEGTFNDWTNKQIGYNSKLTRKQAEEIANTFSARAGESEHQLGTVFDIGCVGCTTFNFSNGSQFGKSCAGKWLRDHAHEHGFIMSYPWGKEQQTCYTSEPWHWRYVGKTLAMQLKQQETSIDSFQTLDEFFRLATGITPQTNNCPQTNPNFKYDQDNCLLCGKERDNRPPCKTPDFCIDSSTMLKVTTPIGKNQGLWYCDAGGHVAKCQNGCFVNTPGQSDHCY